MARTYPIYEAKAKLSEIIRQVKRGRAVTISDRGVAVARVLPVEVDEDVCSRLERLRRSGIIIPATAPVGRIRPIAKRPGALKRFLESRD